MAYFAGGADGGKESELVRAALGEDGEGEAKGVNEWSESGWVQS
jgi:hypothetical protein